jgi:exopolyphosphatase/guanosine-5'-triphosphate,3'-diphosphate pyrophosphatase
MATEIIGLKQSEQDIIAWTARMHSGKVSMDERSFLELSQPDQLQIVKLAAILRLADAMDTGHQQKISEFTTSLVDSEFILTVSTHRDITLEVWTFENKGKLFMDVFGFQPRIKIRRQPA